jgi:nucleotidyltransferase substrate binding protein (TIGR01987 family)
MSAKLRDSLENLSRANEALHEALAVIPRNRVIMSAIIKNFEINYELSWKALKRLLDFHGVSTSSPRQAFAEAFRKRFIDNDAGWLAMIEDRNLSVHTYDESLAKAMTLRIENNYKPLFDQVVQMLSVEVGKA